MAFDCRKIDSENRSIDHVCECEYVRLWYAVLLIVHVFCCHRFFDWLNGMTWCYWFVCADGVSANLLEFRKEVSLKHCWYGAMHTSHAHTSSNNNNNRPFMNSSSYSTISLWFCYHQFVTPPHWLTSCGCAGLDMCSNDRRTNEENVSELRRCGLCRLENCINWHTLSESHVMIAKPSAKR